MQALVGRVREIIRYPVKSMAGEQLETAQIDWQGIDGDRQFAFFRQEDVTSFPWQTGRELPAMVLYSARFREPLMPKTSAVDVIAPDGALWDLRDPAFLVALSELSGCALGLLQVGRGTYDAMPVSVVTTTTHSTLDRICGTVVDSRRFRSNIVVDADVPEAAWAGCRLTFGHRPDSAEVLIADGIERCAMITIDPATAERNPSLMRVVAQQFENRFGVYGSPARPGTVLVGDPVYVAAGPPVRAAAEDSHA